MCDRYVQLLDVAAVQRAKHDRRSQITEADILKTVF